MPEQRNPKAAHAFDKQVCHDQNRRKSVPESAVKKAQVNDTKKSSSDPDEHDVSRAVERAIWYQRNVVENKAGIALAIKQSEGRELDTIDRP